MPRDSCQPCCNPSELARSLPLYRDAHLQILCRVLQATAPENAVAITTSDSTVYSPELVGVYVGGAGDVALLLHGNTSAVTFKSVPVGTTLKMKIQKVMSTGTTATNLVGLY